MPPEPFVPPEDEYEDVDALGQPTDDQAVDETPSATDPKDQARRRRSHAVEAENLARFWHDLMENPIGRLAMWRWLQALHAFETQFATAAGFPQPEATWFKFGEQQSGQRLYQTLMKHNLEATNRMLIEHHPDFAAPPKRRRRKKAE